MFLLIIANFNHLVQAEIKMTRFHKRNALYKMMKCTLPEVQKINRIHPTFRAVVFPHVLMPFPTALAFQNGYLQREDKEASGVSTMKIMKRNQIKFMPFLLKLFMPLYVHYITRLIRQLA